MPNSVKALAVPLLMMACLTSAPVSAAPEIGAAAPDFTARNYVTGHKVHLQAQQGKIVIVTFWASWCGPCLDELPNLENLQRYLGNDKIAVLAVNFKDTPTMIRSLGGKAKQAGWVINLLVDPDGRIASLYEVNAIPRMYIIDREGKIRATHVGFGDGSLDQMLEELNAVFGEGAAAASPPAARVPQHPGAGHDRPQTRPVT